MQKNKLYQGVVLLFSLTLLGCSPTTPSLKQSVVAKQSFSVKSKAVYFENEPVEFKIYTGESTGYLSLIYLGKQEKVNVLYANKEVSKEKSRELSLEKKSGIISFPQDFGKVKVSAKKECESCEKEKTEVLIIFSDDPIVNIENMSKSELLSLNSHSVHVKNRSLSLGKNTTLSSNIVMQKVEFFVRDRKD